MIRAPHRARTHARAIALTTTLIALMLLSTSAAAQTSELTSADRLALLYTSQLIFDDSGEPVVKVGIADGLDTLSFKPNKAIRVLPIGPGGPEIELPGGTTYTVAISDGHPGVYRHHVVLDRFRPDENDALEVAQTKWIAASVSFEPIEIGSLFAIAGTMFDSRETLLVTPGLDTIAAAQRHAKKLASTYDMKAAIHSELTQYPTARLELTGDEQSVVIRHQDILWVALGPGGATVADVPTERGKKDRVYEASLVFSPDRDGTLSMVNAVPVETVLRGVVPAELFSTAPLEALKVQAIAARGTLLSQIGARHMADPYNLCDEQHCQVFAGMKAARKSTDEAVEATRGQVLFSGRRIAETYYSSNCGGRSETPQAVWGLAERDYLHAHDDDADAARHTTPPTEETLAELLTTTPEAWCNTSDYSSGKHFRWERSFFSKKLDELVAKKYDDVGHLTDVIIQERGPSGRVVRLKLVGTKGSRVVERELTVRRLFGSLKSGLFVMDVSRDSNGELTRIKFTGGGFGHGVGMCQTGAMGMAKAGRTYDEILEHYYRSTTLKTLW